jgi:ribosomal protein S18 acetylase RimI-like enzyme
MESIKIQALSEDLMDDYLNFFENVSFSKNNEWGSGCYCIHYHIIDDNDIIISRKETAIQLIKQKKLCGYLAYENDKVIGWCNSGEKTSFKRLNERKEIWNIEDKETKIKSIICYLILPEMRRKGIAKKLMEYACTDAGNNGYSCVEVYPSKNGKNCFEIYHGSCKMYEEYGFTIYKELEEEYIMRKYIK